ncbi:MULTISPECIES: caspase family protein [Devosia]|uniref:caspase family protein n=1 Tax=Devosia TaxID=46913 RepID=UPI0013006386|nr:MULTISPECIES: caspase family protein [Devosia]
MLSILGYEPGDVDGAMGPKTQAAATAFRIKQGLGPDVEGEALLEALRSGIGDVVAKEQLSREAPVALAPSSFTDLQFIQPLRAENLLATGKCEGAHLFRLDSLEPLGVVTSSFCRKVLGVVEASKAAVVAHNGGSIALQDLRTAQTLEMLRFTSGDFISAGAVHERTEQVAFVTGYGKALHTLSLSPPYAERTIGKVAGEEEVYDITFSPDGQYALTTSDTLAQVWDLERGRSLRTYDYARIGALSSSHLALLFASEDDTAWVEVRSIADDALIARSPYFPLGTHYSNGRGVDGSYFLDFVDDGQSVVLFGGQAEAGSTELLKWAVDSQEISSTPLQAPFDGYATIDRAQNRLLVADAGGVRSIDLSGQGDIISRDVSRGVQTMAIGARPDGGQLAIMGAVPSQTSAPLELVLFLLDADNGEVQSIPLGVPVYSSSCFSCETSRKLLYLPGNDRVLFSDSGKITVVTLSSAQVQTVLEDISYESQFAGLALSPDGTQLALGRADGITLHSTADWSVVGTIEHDFDKVFGMPMHYVDGGKNLLIGSNKRIDVFSVHSGQRLLTAPFELRAQGQHYTLQANFIAPMGQGPERYLIGGNAIWGIGKVWVYENGRLRDLSDRPSDLLRSGNSGYVAALADDTFSYDDGNTVVGIDTDTSGQFLLTRHSGTVAGTVALPDGRFVSVGNAGDLVFLRLDLEQREAAELIRTQLFGPLDWVSYTSEGFFVSSGIGDRQLLIRSGRENVSPIETVYDALYRPDLVAAKLLGDPQGLVLAAAAQLDIEAVIDSGLAPNVAISGLDDGTEVDADSITVNASITDRGGGIGKVEWRVNGITLGIEERGFDRLSPQADLVMAQAVAVSQTLSLDPGDNLIEVLAYNESGLVASEPASVMVKWNGASSMAPPRLHVLAVGVDDYYDSRLKLNFAASDARAVGEAFRAAGEKLYQSVEVTTVLDQAVTASNLGQVFADLSDKVRPRDVFVLFMAGHGKTLDGRYYFLPHDFRYTDESSIAAGGIDQDQFQEWLALIPARKSMLLYDTCESGSLTNGAASRGLEEVAALARLTRAMGRTILSASTDNAPAIEGYNGHGVFTYALLKSLEEGDSNGDGSIEVTELAGSIDLLVPQISFDAFRLRQVPQMSIVGSSFPVVQTMAVLGEISPPVNHTPSHVVITDTKLRGEPAEVGAALGQVAPGTLVRVVSQSDGWSEIAREGVILGFVRSATLAAML